jgi:hypothetical protein
MPTTNSGGGAVPATTYSTVSTLAGTGLNNPRGLTTDGAGNIYETDDNSIINVISYSGTVTVTLLSGKAGMNSESTGNSHASRFNGPWGIVYDGTGNLYVCDNGGNTIRKVVATGGSGASTTVAGSGVASENDATGTLATFNGPMGIAYDGSTYLYVCDNGGNKIRRITVSTGAVLTIAGSGLATETDNVTGTLATFNRPAGIVYDGAGNLYVSDVGGNTIRKISTTAPYAVSTIAGSGSAGSADGTGTAASFSAPYSLTKDASGNIIVADEGNNLIRTMTPAGVVTTLAGNGTKAELTGVGTAAEFFSPYTVAADNSGNLFTGDNNAANSTCRKILLTGYTISPTTMPTGLTFTSSTGNIAGTPTAAQAQTSYTITGYNASGSSAFTITIQCVQTNNWTGTTNSRWDVGTNWSTNAAPTANDAVNIGNGSTFTNQPAISNANALAYSVTFGTTQTATLNIGSGFTLTVSKSLNVLSTATPTITGGNSSTSIIYMLPGAGVSVSSTGKLTLNTLNMVLESDPTGDAYIGQVSTSTLTGTALTNISVQRYLTGGSFVYRGYRLLSSPVYATTVGSNNVYSINYLASSTFLTGTGGAPGGFDKGGNPTLYLYRENLIVNTGGFTGGNFRGINNISAAPNYTLDIDGGPFNIPVANGYLCFFRGSRSTVNPFTTTTTPLAVTLTTTGTLNIGNITVSDWFTPASTNLSYTSASPFAGFNLVGNPYPSAIDWDTFQTTALANGGIYGTSTVSKTVYELDPISHNFGAYMAGSGGIGTDNATNIISSGQGFFVLATATTPVQPALTFTESAKTTTQNTGIKLLLGTPVNVTNNQTLMLKLAKDTANTEDIIINFNGQADNNYHNDIDALYTQGYGLVNFSGISQDNVKVAIHAMPLPQLQQKALRLYANASANGNYTLTLTQIKSLPRLYDIWLMDNYTKDSVDMRQNPVYNFTIDKSDTSTFGNYRFALAIRQNQAFAYRLLDFTAAKVRDAREVLINWDTANEGNYTTFTVERSTDRGVTYSTIGGETGAGLGNYGLIDKSPATGRNMYRLKQEDINNAITYSNVVDIEFSPKSNNLTDNSVTIYPNPAVSTVNLAVENQTGNNTSYNILFTNSSGVVVKRFTSAQSIWQGSVSDLEPGTYLVQVLNGKNASLVGQAKLVKM